jgi:hypothetical protein
MLKGSLIFGYGLEQKMPPRVVAVARKINLPIATRIRSNRYAFEGHVVQTTVNLVRVSDKKAS